MRPSDINVIMALLLAVICTTAALIRLSPHQMKRIADWLNARADAEEWFEIRHRLYKRQRAEREEGPKWNYEIGDYEKVESART